MFRNTQASVSVKEYNMKYSNNQKTLKVNYKLTDQTANQRFEI